ncbi:MAG TPA: response regulator [Gallionellaceae bacterium]
MYRILLVDDEPHVLNALRRELQDEYELELFSDPLEALWRCETTLFDLAIADYRMPEMNGIQFLKQLGRLQPDAAHVVLSGHADVSGLASAINDTHIYRFINKPWAKAELAATLAQALRYRKALLESRRRAEGARSVSKAPAAEMARRHQVLVLGEQPNVLSAVVRDLTSRSAFQDLHMALLQEADPGFSASSMDFRFDVHTATSPGEALDYARRVACDVVIADFLFPEMSGLQFFEAFRREQPHVSRIILSGHTDRQVLADALNRLEVFGCIAKPWREYELRSLVVQAVIYKNLVQDNQHPAGG